MDKVGKLLRKLWFWYSRQVDLVLPPPDAETEPVQVTGAETVNGLTDALRQIDNSIGALRRELPEILLRQEALERQLHAGLNSLSAQIREVSSQADARADRIERRVEDGLSGTVSHMAAVGHVLGELKQKLDENELRGQRLRARLSKITGGGAPPQEGHHESDLG